jgi:hypothetical protein
VQQVLEVTTTAPLLQTEAPVRAANITTQQIDQLPLSSTGTRNPAMLALLAPGVTTNKYSTPTQTFSVNGGRGRSNNFMIDGTDNNDISVAGQSLRVANPGLVQEVNVQTANYDAEFGRAGGAVVNLITRSGTNNFHGTAGFVLDSTWDDAISSSLARSAEVQTRGRNLPGTEQQFDGTLGGPIVKDKTFFHLSYLHLRQFSTVGTELRTFSPAGRDRFRQLFPQGRSANADQLLAITEGFDASTGFFNIDLGDGRGPVEFGLGTFSFPFTATQRQAGIKLDHVFSERDIISGRFVVDDQVLPSGGERSSFPSFNTSATTRIYNSGITETHVFSPTVTNELRLAFTRYNFDAPLDPENPIARTLPQIVIQGINTTTVSPYGIQATFPQGRIYNNYVLQDTVSWTRGKHTVRFGVDLTRQRARQAAPFNERGTLTYAASTGYTGLANYVDDFGGSAGSVTRVFGNPFYYPSLFRQAYFVQDRWRVGPSLTLSLGLRYENFGTPMNVIPTPAFAGIFNTDPATFYNPFAEANEVEPDNNNFSPAVGMAYAPSFTEGILGRLLGDRKTSFRTGYGIGYDSFFNNITSNASAAAPNNLAALVNSQVNASQPRGLSSLSTLFPTSPPAPTPALSQTGIIRNLRNPYYQRWSFTIQRELANQWVIDIGYVGSKGTRLFVNERLNPQVPTGLRGAVPAGFDNRWTVSPRLDPLSGNRLIRTNGGDSNYHSGQFEVKRRWANGLRLGAAYTWSKAIDNGSEIFQYGGTSSLQDLVLPSYYGGLQLDRAVSFFDRPHRLVFNYIWDIPVMQSQRGVLGRVFGGWQLAGITTYESGVPYTVLNGQDADGLEGNDRPNFNPLGQSGVRALPNPSSPTGYVNPDAGNAPIDPATARYIGLAANTGTGIGTVGNLGRNTERGLPLKNWDVNVTKFFRITESVRIEFRTEFFNLFNTPQYGTVSVSPFGPPQNGQTISANLTSSQPGLFLNETFPDGGGRVIRWQLRLHF